MSKEIEEAYAKVNKSNSLAALEHSKQTKELLTSRIDRLENLVRSQQVEIFQLNKKCNLLLTKNFNRGSTTEQN